MGTAGHNRNDPDVPKRNTRPCEESALSISRGSLPRDTAEMLQASLRKGNFGPRLTAARSHAARQHRPSARPVGAAPGTRARSEPAPIGRAAIPELGVPWRRSCGEKTAHNAGTQGDMAQHRHRDSTGTALRTPGNPAGRETSSSPARDTTLGPRLSVAVSRCGPSPAPQRRLGSAPASTL